MNAAPLPEPVIGYLQRHGIVAAQVLSLTGDASDRRYFRVVPPNDESFVLAVHTAPFDPATLPFINVAKLLAAMPLPVPRVRGVAGDLGVLALDDLGDVTLQAHLGGSPDANRTALYQHAVELIEVLQRRGADLADSRFVPYGVAFDVEKLMWEMDFFIKHFLEAYRGVSFGSGERDALRTALHGLSSQLAAEPRVLCHRDYHSRNLMVRDHGLFVIDFQDARMGPDTYDLVSLLRDSYVDLPPALVDELIARFAATRPGSPDLATFRRRFDAMALQRNLKALGTFGFQTVSRGNPVYMQYIPRTLRYVRETLASSDHLAPLRSVLSPLVDEGREDAGLAHSSRVASPAS